MHRKKKCYLKPNRENNNNNHNNLNNPNFNNNDIIIFCIYIFFD